MTFAMDNPKLYGLMERIGNLLRSEIRKVGNDSGLQPVHLQVLNYLSQCNRYSDTSVALTEYLGATKGTISQTLKILEKKNYISRVADCNDKRVQHLAVSESGFQVLASCVPPVAYFEAAGQITESESRDLIKLLTRLLQELQRANQSRTFGVCKTCRFFLSDGMEYRCGLTREALSTADSEKICREHTRSSEPQEAFNSVRM